MEINIGCTRDDSRSTSTLSGGERSFGTMALLIALWYVTKLPFYFMDEFDVFMVSTSKCPVQVGQYPWFVEGRGSPGRIF